MNPFIPCDIKMLSSSYHSMSGLYMKPVYNCHHTFNNQLGNFFSFPHSYLLFGGIAYYEPGKLVGQLNMYQVNISRLYMVFSGIF